MPDVRVKYDPTGAREFTFRPYALTMTDPGLVILTRQPASAQWKFVTATFKDDPSRQFHVRLLGEGEALQIIDDCRDDEPALYMYNVTIALQNGDHVTSPDPVIVNDPGARLEDEADAPTDAANTQSSPATA